MDAQYKTFDTAYERKANMVLYSVKQGANEISLSDSLIAKRTPIVAANFARQSAQFDDLDVTPYCEDIKDGEFDYNGEVTWTYLGDQSTGKITPVDNHYIFNGQFDGVYRLDFSSINYSMFELSHPFSVYINVSKKIAVHYVDENGRLIRDSYFVENSKYTFEDYKPVDGSVFIGWVYNDGIYPSGFSTYLDGETTLKAYTLKYNTVDSPHLRYVRSSNYNYGLMQDVEIDQTKYDYLVSKGYLVRNNIRGFVIPTDMVEGTSVEPSQKGLVIDDMKVENGHASFGICNLKSYNYNRDFSFISYLTFRYSDKSSKIIKTDYSTEKNVANAYEVALETLKDTSLTSDQKLVCEKFTKTVINLNQEGSNITIKNSGYSIGSFSINGGNCQIKINISANDMLFFGEFNVNDKLSMVVNENRKLGIINEIGSNYLLLTYSL